MNITQYIKIRNKKTKQVKKVVGCLAATKKDDKVYIGYTKYAKNKENCKYCKTTSRDRALDRAIVHANANRAYEVAKLPFAVQDALLDFVERAEKYFKAPVANITGLHEFRAHVKAKEAAKVLRMMQNGQALPPSTPYPDSYCDEDVSTDAVAPDNKGRLLD